MKNSSADLDKIEDQSMQYETNVSPINSGPGLSSEQIIDFPTNNKDLLQQKKPINLVEDTGRLSFSNKKVKFQDLKVVAETKEEGGDKDQSPNQINEQSAQRVSETKLQSKEMTPQEKEATLFEYLKDVESRAKKAQLPTSKKRDLSKIASKRSTISIASQPKISHKNQGS